MRGFVVDRDSVYAALRDAEMPKAVVDYRRMDEVFLDIQLRETCIWLLTISVLLVVVASGSFAIMAFGLGWEINASLACGVCFLSFGALSYVVNSILARRLPATWQRHMEAIFESNGFTEDDLERLGFSIVRTYDWRLDIVLTRMGMGVRVTDPRSDFEPEVVSNPSWRDLKLFLTYWVQQPVLIAVVLFGAATMTHFGWEQAYDYITQPILWITMVMVTQWALGFPRLAKERNESWGLRSTLRAHAKDTAIGLGYIPDLYSCIRIVRAVEAESESGIKYHTLTILQKMLRPLDTYLRRHSIEEAILPALQEQFGTPLPPGMQAAIDEFMETDCQ